MTHLAVGLSSRSIVEIPKGLLFSEKKDDSVRYERKNKGKERKGNGREEKEEDVVSRIICVRGSPWW